MLFYNKCHVILQQVACRFTTTDMLFLQHAFELYGTP
jgi:hypothetical protein